MHLSESSIYYGQEILGVLPQIVIQNMVNSIKFSKVVPFSAGPSLASLAIVSVWQSCGRPSTNFPHGELDEFLLMSRPFYIFLLKNLKLSFFLFFLEMPIFPKFLEIWNTINLARAFALSDFITSISIFDIRSTRFSVGFLEGYLAEHCQLDKIWVVLYKSNRAVNRKPGFRSEDGKRAVNRQPSFRTEDS